MEFIFSDAEVEVGGNHDLCIELRCVRSVDGEGNRVDPKSQVPTIVSMDNYQAYLFAMQILKQIEVEDFRGSH